MTKDKRENVHCPVVYQQNPIIAIWSSSSGISKGNWPRTHHLNVNSPWHKSTDEGWEWVSLQKYHFVFGITVMWTNAESTRVQYNPVHATLPYVFERIPFQSRLSDHYFGLETYAAHSYSLKWCSLFGTFMYFIINTNARQGRLDQCCLFQIRMTYYCSLKNTKIQYWGTLMFFAQ